jgi:rubredoxin-NAD+ reductase
MTAVVETTQWICKTCGWVYDEQAGAPDHGLAPGTKFADIPDDWYCPDCGVTKADFEPLEF